MSELFFLQDTGVAPPTNTVAPTISGTAQVGATLTAANGTWTGSPSFTYQWRLCNSGGTSCSDIVGAVASTYIATTADLGGTIRVVVTGTNAGGQASATSAQTGVVAAQPAPVNTVLPVISGTAQVGSVLSTTTGTWTNNPSGYTYQWRRCNSSGASCANISGATLSVYVLTSADQGQTIRVVVTATNTGGSTAATSAQTGVVAAAPPADLTFMSLGPNLPTVQVAIAMAGPGGESFGSGPAAPPASPVGMASASEQASEFGEGEATSPDYPLAQAWLNVNAYVRSFSLTRGRQDELGRVATATLQVTLSNRDRRFDPTYTAGPHYGQLEPMRRIRVQAQWNGIIYNLFHGYIEGWPQSYPGGGYDAVVELTASDAFKVLNLFDLEGKEYPEQRSDQRVQVVLSDAGFVYGEYSLNTGQSVIAASGTVSSTPALSHLLEVDKSEQGLFFMNGGGTAIFQDRHYRTRNQTASLATLGTATGEVPYREIGTDYDDQRLWNVARVTPAGGTVAQVSINAASTASYYPRVLAETSLSPSENDALALAHYYTYTYATPKMRVPKVDLVVGSTVANPTPLWATVLARELSDRVTFKVVPPGGGTITADQHLEAISVKVSKPRAEFDVSWLLSPVNPHTYWRLGNPTYGRLGYNARIGF